jgi:hypothetical protein
MHALFGQQRSAMRYRRFRDEANVPAPFSVEAVLEAATVNGARAAGLEGVDLAKLAAEVSASRDYLLKASGYRPELFKKSAAQGRTDPKAPPTRNRLVTQ